MSKVLAWLLIVAAAYGILSLFAHRSLYYPFRFPQGLWELQGPLGAADVWLWAADGVRLHAWWIGSRDAPLATLYLHGNGGNITHRADHARAITAAGSALLLLDYRGYGRSEGRPTEEGLYADAEAAYQHLRKEGFRPERIVLHGESLGSGAAVELASHRPCAGVILEAPFPSVQAVAGRILPVLGPLMIRGFDSKSRIRNIRAPVLIVHGDRDEVVDFDMGRELFEAAAEPKAFWAVSGAGHNNIVEVAGPQYRARLKSFYDSLFHDSKLE